jgi:hypothetical protein
MGSARRAPDPLSRHYGQVGVDSVAGADPRKRIGRAFAPKRRAFTFFAIALAVGLVFVVARTLGSGDATPSVDAGPRLSVKMPNGPAGWIARSGFTAPSSYQGHVLVYARPKGDKVVGWFYPKCAATGGFVAVNTVLTSCPRTNIISG